MLLVFVPDDDKHLHEDNVQPFILIHIFMMDYHIFIDVVVIHAALLYICVRYKSSEASQSDDGLLFLAFKKRTFLRLSGSFISLSHLK